LSWIILVKCRFNLMNIKTQDLWWMSYWDLMQHRKCLKNNVQLHNIKKKCILCMIWTNTVTLIATKSQCSFLHKTKCLCNYCPCDQNYCQLSPLRSVLIFGINRPLFRSLWKESVNNDGQQFHQYQQENCMFESAYHIIIHISITRMLLYLFISYKEYIFF
jgi:hypothetical protein